MLLKKQYVSVWLALFMATLRYFSNNEFEVGYRR